MQRTMPTTALESKYRGLRMTADEYLELPDDGHRYELIDGVICMSPSPSLPHQRIATEIASQIGQHVANTRSGAVVIEVDVRLSDDIVYRPDVIYLSNEKLAQCGRRVTVPPDVIIEVVSPESGAYDRQTKLGDYERSGVSEYWIVDPIAKSFEFHRLRGGKYESAPVDGVSFASEAIQGFSLDMARLKSLFD